MDEAKSKGCKQWVNNVLCGVSYVIDIMVVFPPRVLPQLLFGYLLLATPHSSKL